MPFSYRKHLNLNRCKPERKCPRIVFDEYAEEAFQRTHQRPVYHDRPVLFAVSAPVGHIEPLGVIEIHLYSAALPWSVQRVLDLDVDLRSVENTFSRVYS